MGDKLNLRPGRVFFTEFCIAAAAAVAFSGCGGHTASSAPTSGESSVNAVSGDRRNEMTIWLLNQDDSINPDNIDAFVRKVCAGTGYDVGLEVIRNDNLHKHLSESYAVGNAPDIVIGYEASPSIYADLGLTIDLTPVKQEVLQLFPQETDVLQSAWLCFMKSGLQYGIPVAWSSYGILYNTAVFAEAGIDRVPHTYAEWLSTCEKLKSAGFIPWVSGTSKIGEPDADLISFWTASNNAPMFTYSGRADMGNKACNEVWEFLEANIENEYTAGGMLYFSSREAVQLFEEGNVGMYIGNLPPSLHSPEAYNVMPAPAGPSAENETRNRAVRFKTAFCLRSARDKAAIRMLEEVFSDSYLLWEDTDVIPFIGESYQETAPYSALLRDWRGDTFAEHNVVTAFYPLTTYPPYGEEIVRSGALSDVLTTIYAGGTLQEGILYADYEINSIIDYYENR